MPRQLPESVLMLFLVCTPAQADGAYNPWRAFGIDEIRLGAMKPNLEGRHGGTGISFTPEAGVEVNSEVLFVSPWPQLANCAAAPATDPATPRAAPSLPSRSLNSSAPENPTNTGFNS